MEDDVFLLHDDLLNGRYRHGSYHRFHIFDPKHRVIHKATVRDRLVHHAVYRVLYPVFDRSFIFDSYSCRIKKGTHAAVDRLEQFTRQVSQNNTKPCWALKFDIRKFFDSVDHGILMEILRGKLTSAAPSSSPLERGRVEQLVSNIVGSYLTSNPIGGGVISKEDRLTDWKPDKSVICEYLHERI
ncbi:hypothetical protein EPN81_00545 [Patescibacteria group bacterium]|nr:MAG: hypothetical protein EPN81_00545 [Patescibacteria group bacterium]